VKRVLLINTNTERAPYPVPPVGVCLVAASLGGRYDVRVFDGTFGEAGAMHALLADFNPHYLGLSIRNIDDVTMGSGRSFVDEIQRDFIAPVMQQTSALLILGGSGFSIFPLALLELYKADYGVVGEAEDAFPALLDALEAGEDPLGLPGVVARGSRCPAPLAFRGAEPGAALALPHSEVDAFIDYTPYCQRGSYPIQTKRGCPHGCVYCTYTTIEGRRYRLRSPEAVVDEIESVSQRLGDVSLELVDSTFSDPPGHAEAICGEVIRRGLKVRLRTMGVNPGGVTRELIRLMREAGFAQIDCTPDSASPRILTALRKGFGLEQLERAARILSSCAMPTMWFFLFGGPGECEETIQETFNFVDAFVEGEDMVHMTEGLRIYPGTPLHQTALAEGLVQQDDPLLEPRFYVSPTITPERLSQALSRAGRGRPNCVHARESAPDPAMLRQALALRTRHGLDEPMFRTLLRLRRERLGKRTLVGRPL